MYEILRFYQKHFGYIFAMELICLIFLVNPELREKCIIQVIFDVLISH